jgi:DNA-binding MarR family transcriptional regulator
MPIDEEIQNLSLQFLKEVYKNSKNNIPIKKYIIGDKLGLDPTQTQIIIDLLKQRNLVNEEPNMEERPMIQSAPKLKITDEGKAIISSNEPLTH